MACNLLAVYLADTLPARGFCWDHALHARWCSAFLVLKQCESTDCEERCGTIYMQWKTVPFMPFFELLLH